MKIEQSAEVKAIRAKKGELSIELTAVDGDRRRLAQDDAPDEIPRDPMAARTAELLGEAPPQFSETKAEKLHRLAMRSRELRAAIEVLSHREQAAVHRWESEVRAGVSEEHKRRLKAVVAALTGLHAANLSLSALADEIEQAGVSAAALRADYPTFIGRPKDPQSPMAHWLRHAAEVGAMSSRDIPQELQYR
ncbi:hypothetical protein [Affinirhizobium pseudoryzae]|uniref:hypothetical protein n=1 Tax=Allorhizobium pseudoryzae TaxID=379684 RepID=UPI0013ED8783|nr:hypothetical protein [Allorhizobium pseudoryzae]